MAILDLEIYSVTVKNQYDHIVIGCNNTNSCCKLNALGIECQGQSCLLAVCQEYWYCSHFKTCEMYYENVVQGNSW